MPPYFINKFDEAKNNTTSLFASKYLLLNKRCKYQEHIEDGCGHKDGI